jgi:Domain of unknown function (DU1801)
LQITFTSEGEDQLERVMTPFASAAVAQVFEAYPANMRSKLLLLRELILETAASTAEVGTLEETLKWGEPAYLTSSSGSGSTIRIAWKRAKPTEYAMYFNCKTTLVDRFKTLFPNEFKFEGNRAIVFTESQVPPNDVLAFCIEAALTYHSASKRRA